MVAPHVRKMKKGQMLLYQGEVPTGVYYIKSGLVRGTNISKSGEEKTVALFGEGDYLPIGYLFGRTPVALFYYEVMADAKVEFYDRDAFLDKLRRDKPLEPLAHMSTQYVSALLQINALGQTRAKDRILRIMQFLALRFGDKSRLNKNYTRISTPFTQQDIASLAGLTRETTAIELNKLKKKRAIIVRRKTYTVHMQKLLSAVGEEELDSVEF